MHGGAAPQVKQAAERRLAALVDPAIAVLDKAMKHKDIRTAVVAAKDVLDRAGMSKPIKNEHSGPDGGPIAYDVTLAFE